MAEQVQQAPVQSKALVMKLWRAPLKILLWIGASLFISLILEWILMTLVWYEQGSAHSRNVLINELGYINNNLTASVLGLDSPSVLASKLSDWLYYWLFTWTGLDSALIWMGSLGTIVGEYVAASLNIVQIFLLRLAITIASLPLFILFAYWGFFEGLVRRDLRRYGADYEHGMIFKWARYIASSMFILPIIIYLTIPISLNPVYVFLPFAVLLSIIIMVVSTTFTKYI